MNEIEKAYLAGLFDGEGTVSIIHLSRRLRSGGLIYCLSLANTDESILYWMQSIVGFGKVETTHMKRSPAQKPTYRWVVTKTGDILTFLMAIRAYTRIKASAIGIAISILENRIALRNINKRHPITEFDFQKVKELSLVNKRGV